MPLLIILIFAVALIILSPIATIASLNLLFDTNIPLTFWTWIATLWLTSIIATRARFGND